MHSLMFKQIWLGILTAVVLSGCSQRTCGPGIGQPTQRQAVLFATIGSQPLQDFVFVIQLDGSALCTLLAAQTTRSFTLAHGNSLRTHLVVTVNELTPQQTFENHLFLYEPGRGSLQRLPLPDGTVGFARLAPDDKRIAFEFTPRLQPTQIQLWVFDLETRQARMLSGSQGVLERYPSWRWDGQEILFLRLQFSNQAQPSTLMSIASTGGTPRAIFGPEEAIGAATFSPTRDAIAMWSRNGLETVEIPDLNRRTVLPASAFLSYEFLATGMIWSGLEQKVAFTLFNTRLNQYELWAVGSDGTGAAPIHSTSKDNRIVVGVFVQQ